MGLLEQVIAGTQFSRQSTTITGTIAVTGSFFSGSLQDFGGSYILLDVTSNKPAWIRLYSDSGSMEIDKLRTKGTYEISSSVALVADIILDTTQSLSLHFDPPIIGTTFKDGYTWYTIRFIDYIIGTGSLGTSTTTFTSYPLAVTGDSLTDKHTLLITGSNISSTGYGVSGSITTNKSFIILSGSACSESRLRLYSGDISEVPFTETTRSFGTAPVTGSKLIADIMFDSASYQYKFVPLVEAYTWQSNAYTTGTGTVGYILQNRSANPTTSISSSLYILSTE
jgi:hypothetical protein